jgi:hypothetical protein
VAAEEDQKLTSLAAQGIFLSIAAGWDYPE